MIFGPSKIQCFDSGLDPDSTGSVDKESGLKKAENGPKREKGKFSEIKS
jgi:hypothetical protein